MDSVEVLQMVLRVSTSKVYLLVYSLLADLSRPDFKIRHQILIHR
ncbi:hypothetical protein SLEP1_g41656 [Rubroshorea leprosula]|uniref:Uncharacterized protein n=1 Tax=Rubroshorea leprosula TaxID=152421 RepID=A0AAV5L773_9ROSI|nr:hypothetical protein SLEP1_g41656 [Rubroshorea leprosula]